MKDIAEETRINSEIRAREVRVIAADGEQLGIMSPSDALQKAEEASLDLVEVAPQAKPPVCRIMDYGRFLYQQSKRDRTAKKKRKSTALKEIRMRPNIDTHDLQVKIGHARDFLENGDRLRLTMMFRGREMAHQENGHKVLKKAVEMLSDLADVDQMPRREGRRLVMSMSPKKTA